MSRDQGIGLLIILVLSAVLWAVIGFTVMVVILR